MPLHWRKRLHEPLWRLLSEEQALHRQRDVCSPPTTNRILAAPHRLKGLNATEKPQNPCTEHSVPWPPACAGGRQRRYLLAAAHPSTPPLEEVSPGHPHAQSRSICPSHLQRHKTTSGKRRSMGVCPFVGSLHCLRRTWDGWACLNLARGCQKSCSVTLCPPEDRFFPNALYRFHPTDTSGGWLFYSKI